MRVLIVAHSHPKITKGGGEIAAYRQFQALAARPGVQACFAGWSPVNAYLPEGSAFTMIGRDEVLFRTRHDPFSLSVLADGDALDRLTALLRQFRPDVVHFHHYYRVGIELFALCKAVLPGVRVCLTLHEYLALCPNDGQMLKTSGALCHESAPAACATCFQANDARPYFLRDAYIKNHFHYVDRFFAPSHFLRERYIAWGIPPDRIAQLDNGYPDTVTAEVPPPGLHASFAYFGQINRYKGVDVFLEAVLALPPAERAAMRFQIYGGGLDTQPKAFQDRVAALIERCAGSVTVNGRYDEADAVTLMRTVGWIVMPSRWWENAPVVVDEARAAGRPMLCSNIGGMKEKIVDAGIGLSFVAGSALDLARRFVDCAGDAERWRALRAKITPPAPVGRVVDQLLQAYR